MISNKTSIRVRHMFSTISKRYDLMNSLMTFGHDRTWRRYLVHHTVSPSMGKMLDIGCGTGKLALEAKKKESDLFIVAADFTLEMMVTGKKTFPSSGIFWCGADALQLPFPDSTFDVVTSGYLIRNVVDLERSFQEQFRVLRQGGRVACLDTSPPGKSILRPFILGYFKYFIPLLGACVTGNREAYEYLPASTTGFKKPEDISEIMRDAGFEDIFFRYFMFRTMSVIFGTKPGNREDGQARI